MPELCYIALGSNVGDRLRFLSCGVQRLRALPGLQLQKTSSLFSTRAQYVTDQPHFLNAVTEWELSENWSKDVPGLLAELKRIEEELGRRKDRRHGPRVLDLDIVAVGERQLSVTGVRFPLEIPHISMHERDFVLVPMAELCPDWRHPGRPGRPSVIEMLKELQVRPAGGGPPGASPEGWPVQVIPGAGGLTGSGAGSFWLRGERTLIMGILNVTPDSFSDGGELLDPAAALAAAREMISAGAMILDIGGESTRPGAPLVPVDEEIRRVIPVISALRAAGIDTTISVDTRKAAVARAAVEAGADWINDVSGGEFDPEMLPTAAELLVPIVLMHMRGTPETMNSLASYDNVVEEVVQQLLLRRSAAEAAGVPSWNILLDPGIGFAKAQEHNLQLLRHAGELVERLKPSPVLVGASRKRFLGTILDEPDARKRIFGNAAVTAVLALAGVDVVRVHEVREMAQTALVCDEILQRSKL